MSNSDLSVEKFLEQGWSYHDSNSSGLAAELEAMDLASVESSQAAALLKLSNHTIGEHLKDWPRACVLARNLWQQVVGAHSDFVVAANLYVAEQLGGDPGAAARAELAALNAIDRTDPLAMVGVNLQCKVMLAAALIGSGSLEQGAQLYVRAVAIAQASDSKLNCDRVLAITSNNLAGELLAVEKRSVSEDELLLASATTALEFWRRCGTWLNEVRGLYLLQCVYNDLHSYQAAVDSGEQGLEVLAQHGPEPTDEAFMLLALSASQQQLGLADRARESLANADALAALWDDASLRSFFADERRKVEAGSEERK